MKHILPMIFVFAVFYSFSQEKEFYLQGQVVDENNNPISDTYIFNERSSAKSVSRDNGIFDVMVLPGDSIIITHISFIRKVVTVHQLMVDPVVQLELDTINIRSINISASERSDYEKAMKNMEKIEFDFRPQPDDAYTETERMKNLLNTENQVERAYSHSLNFLQFSPSEEIGKLISKRKKKKAANQFSSTKDLETEKDK
jgi:hypothetical protein